MWITRSGHPEPEPEGLWVPRISSGLVTPPSDIRGSDQDRVSAVHSRWLGTIDLWRWFDVERGQLTQGPVGPMTVVAGHVLGQDSLRMSTAEHEHPVEALDRP